MKLTTEQKRSAYEWALQNFRRFKAGPFLCNILITTIFGPTTLTAYHCPNISRAFPEFWAQKPEGIKDGHPWWLPDEEGNLYRELALKKALQLLDKEEEQKINEIDDSII